MQKLDEILVDKFTNIYLDNNSAYKKILRTQANQRLNKSVLSGDSIIYKLDELGDIKSGKYTIDVHGVKFEIFLNITDIRSNLVVFFPGATADRSAMFNRWSWSPYTCSISFSDPMFTEYNLTLGWFFGTTKHDYREYASLIIKSVADKLGVDHCNILLYGSSAGGTVALFVSEYIEKSKTIALNPQINLNEYNPYAVKKIENIIGCKTDENELKDRLDPLPVIKGNIHNKYLVAFNCRSSIDFEQIEFLARTFDMKVKYGINKQDNLLLWAYCANSTISKYTWSYHNSQDSLPLFYILCKTIENWETTIEASDQSFIIISELWAERFELMHQSLLYQCFINRGEISSKFLLCEAIIEKDPYLNRYLSELNLEQMIVDCLIAHDVGETPKLDLIRKYACSNDYDESTMIKTVKSVSDKTDLNNLIALMSSAGISLEISDSTTIPQDHNSSDDPPYIPTTQTTELTPIDEDSQITKNTKLLE